MYNVRFTCMALQRHYIRSKHSTVSACWVSNMAPVSVDNVVHVYFNFNDTTANYFP